MRHPTTVHPRRLGRVRATSLRDAAGRRATRQVDAPRCEPLEPRQLLAIAIWDGGGGSDTSWNNPANWAGNILPAAIDDVFIGVAPAPPIAPGTLISVSGPAAAGFLNSAASLVINPGADLFINTGATVPAIEMAGGQIRGGDPSGPLTSATLTVPGGIATDRSNRPANGPTAIRNMAILGPVAVNAFDQLELDGGSLTGPLDVEVSGSFTSGNGWIHNGLFSIADGASGTFSTGIALQSLNAGVGATLNFLLGGTIAGATSIRGNITTNAQLNFLGIVDLLGGSIGGAGSPRFASTINWTEGTIGGIAPTVPVGGTLNILTNAPKSLACDTLSLEGTTNWTGDGIIAGNPLLTPRVINAGTLTIPQPGSRGFQSTLFGGAFDVGFTNNGTFNLNAGGFRASTFDTHSGDFTLAAGTNLTLRGSNSLAAAASITGLGNVELDLAASSQGSIAITGGLVLVAPGPNSGTVTFSGPISANTLQIGDAFSAATSRFLRLTGLVTITTDVSVVNRGNAIFGASGFPSNLTFGGRFDISAPLAGNPTAQFFGPTSFTTPATFAAGLTTFHSTFTSTVAPVFSGGNVTFKQAAAFAGQVVFADGTITFENTANFGTSPANSDPRFHGATVEFQDDYLAKRDLLEVTGGAVKFLDPVATPYVFQNIALSGTGVIEATTDRTAQTGSLSLSVSSNFNWQGGTIRNFNLTVLPGATATAGGATKTLENNFPPSPGIQINFLFSNLAWTGGTIDLVNNVGIFGNTAVAATVVKSAAGNLTRTTTIPTQGGGEWFPQIVLGLFHQTSSEGTVIEGIWSPATHNGELRVAIGDVTLPDWTVSPFTLGGTTLAQGRWTIGGRVLLPGATIATLGGGVTVELTAPLADFPALGGLSTNRGTLTFRNGYRANLQPNAAFFLNDTTGVMRFLGGVPHVSTVPIHNAGRIEVRELSTLDIYGGLKTLPGGMLAASFETDVGSTTTIFGLEGVTTLIEHASSTPFSGGGSVVFVGQFEQRFLADALISVGEMVFDSHTFSGPGAVTLSGTVRYGQLTIAPGGGETRIAFGGSLTPHGPNATLTLGRALRNDGSLTAHVTTTSPAASLVNGPGGVFELRGVEGPGPFTNAGTLRAAPGAPTRTISSAFFNTSAVPIQLASAGLTIQAPISNSGTIAASGPGLLTLDGDIENSSAIAFDGTGEIRFAPGASFTTEADTELRSAILVLSDANEIRGNGRIIVAGLVQYGLLVLGRGEPLVIAASGALTPASTASSLAIDREVSVHGLLGGLITTGRASIITIQPSGTLDLNAVTGFGEVHNYGLIRNSSGVPRTLSVPLLQASGQAFEAPGQDATITLEGDTLVTGTFGTSLGGFAGGGALITTGDVFMTAGSISGPGTLHVHARFTIAGGSTSPVGDPIIVHSTGTLTIDFTGPGFLPFGRSINNAGIIEWKRGNLSGPATLTNLGPTGRVLLTAQQGEHVWSGTGAARVVNRPGGTIERNGAAGTHLFQLPLDVRAGSTLKILDGDLGALGGGFWVEGVEIPTGSTLELGDPSHLEQLALSPSAPVTGGGNIVLRGTGLGGVVFGAPVNIGGNVTVLSGRAEFRDEVIAGGNLMVQGGELRLLRPARFGGLATLSGGTLSALDSLTIVGTALFSGTNATLSGPFACANAEFRSNSVLFKGSFTTNNQEPIFTGAFVEFGGVYAASTAHLLIQSGRVQFNRDVSFAHVELLGAGAISGDRTRSAAQEAVRFGVSQRFDWGGGTFNDLRVAVGTDATFIAFGGEKAVNFLNPALAAPLTFGTLSWAQGDIRLRNGASLSGAVVSKIGPGNLTRTTTIAPPGGGQWQADVIVNLFEHAWTGTTTIDAQWNPGTSRHMRVLQGGVTLNDLSEFTSASALTAGTWTVHGTLTLPGATLTATVPGTSVTLVGSASSFAAINTLAVNGGSLFLEGGKAFSFLPTGTTFTNQGALYLDGGILHTPQRTIVNDGITFVGASTTLRLDRSAFNAGTFHVGTTGLIEFFAPIGDVITHSGPQAYAGGGTVRVGFGTSHVFNADTVIELGTFNQAGPHGWGGNATIEFHGVFSQTSRDFGIGAGITLRIEEGASFTSVANNIILEGALDVLGSVSGPSINLANANARITNHPTGVMSFPGASVSGTGTFNNFGTINVSGTGATFSTVFNHHTTIPFNIAAGSLNIGVAGTAGLPVTNSGTFAVNGPGTLSFPGGVPATHTGPNPFAGDGRIVLGRPHNFTAQNAVISATNVDAQNMTIGGPGSVLLTGQMVVGGGFTTAFASNFTVGPTGRMTSTSTSIIRAAFVNHGTITASGAFNLDQPTALFTNAADGVLNLANHNTVGLGSFNNAGTVNVADGNATISVANYNHQSTIPFNIAPAATILDISSAITNSGTFAVNGAGLLRFLGASPATHSGANPFAGDGRIELRRADSITAQTAIISATNINANGNGFVGPGSAVLTGRIVSGTLFTSLAQGFTIAPTGVVSGGVVTQAALVNQGVITVVGNINVASAGAVFTNAAVGVINLFGPPVTGVNIVGAGTFVNAGTFNITTSSAVFSVANYNHQSTIPFNIAPAATILDISSAITNSGTFAVNGAGLLRLLVGNNTAATHTGVNPFAGTGRIQLLKVNNFTAQSADISATNITASNMTFGGTGSVLLTGQMTFPTGATIIFASDFTVAPTGRMTGINSTIIRAAFVNHGIITAGSSFNLQQATAVFTNAAGGVVNLSNHTTLGLGTLTNAGTINVTSGVVAITATLAQQTGTIRVLSGTLTLPAFPQLASGSLSAGTLSVGAGTLNVVGTITTIGAAATVELTHPAAVFNSINVLNTVSGTLRLSGGRNLATTGNFTNAGTLDLSTSTLSITGTYTQIASGTLRTDLSTPASFGRVAASGAINLAGALDARLAPTFLLPPGSALSVATGSTRNGEFTSASLPPQFGTLTFALAHLSQSATIATGITADFNGDGVTNPDDLADFITLFFSAQPGQFADINGDGVVNPDDLSDYLTLYFSI